MMWSDGSWGWWWLAPLFMFACMLMMVRMMGHGGHGHGSDAGGVRSHAPRAAERILAERFARGEIDVGEYEHRLRALRGTSGPDTGGDRNTG